MKKLFVLISLIFITACSCSEFTVKTQLGVFGPDVYELTNGGISIKYYNGNCCCIAKDVLVEMKNRIEKGVIEIDSLKSKKFVDSYLRDLCWLIKSEKDLYELKMLNSTGKTISERN